MLCSASWKDDIFISISLKRKKKKEKKKRKEKKDTPTIYSRVGYCNNYSV